MARIAREVRSKENLSKESTRSLQSNLDHRTEGALLCDLSSARAASVLEVRLSLSPIVDPSIFSMPIFMFLLGNMT